ncbi:MAG: hypothetical protein U0X39_01875 [Bacteroidales bacterium]
MKTIDFSYFIERYISGEMDATEKRWFEKELDGNESLRKEVALRRKADQHMLKPDIISLRNKLADLEKSRKEKAISDARRRPNAMRFAAVFTGLVLIGSLFLLRPSHMSNSELLSEFMQPITIETTGRSGNTDAALQNFSRAAEYFNSNDYVNAGRYFSLVLQEDPERLDAHLYKGISELKTNLYKEAKSEFTFISNKGRSLYKDNAKFHLALCFIATNDIEAARGELREIANNKSNQFRKEARKLLRRL